MQGKEPREAEDLPNTGRCDRCSPDSAQNTCNGYLCLPRIPCVSQPASLWHANRRSRRCTLVSLLASTSEPIEWQSSASSGGRVHPGAGVRVAKESGFDQQEFGRLDQGEEAFPLRKVNVDAKGLLQPPAKRRVAGIGGVIPRPGESLPRAPVSAIPLPWAPGRLCPRLNAYVTADSSQNSYAVFDATISRSTR